MEGHLVPLCPYFTQYATYNLSTKFGALFFSKLIELCLGTLWLSSAHGQRQGLRNFLCRDPHASFTAVESLF